MTHYELCPSPCCDLTLKGRGVRDETLLDRLHVFLDFRRVFAAAERILSDKHLPSGFRAADARALLAVVEAGSHGLEAVSRRLRLTKPATGLVLRRLQERGYVRRGAGKSAKSLLPRPGRSAYLLTSSGRDAAARSSAFYEEVMGSFSALFSSEDVVKFRELSDLVARGYESWRSGGLGIDDEEEEA
jgi:DNA-binding MarR family transcriptional regulator